jgi:hypothetical protein
LTTFLLLLMYIKNRYGHLTDFADLEIETMNASTILHLNSSNEFADFVKRILYYAKQYKPIHASL